MTEAARRTPYHKVYPQGSTKAPAVCCWPIADFPAARDNPDLSTRIDWTWIETRLDAGSAVGIAVDPADTEALRDTVESRLGTDLIARWDDSGALFLCRPWALPWHVTETER